MKVQKTILVDAQEMELWRLKHPRESFSAWVRYCIQLDVLPHVEPKNSSYTLDAVIEHLPPPDPATDRPRQEVNPLDIPDRDLAEQRARQIMAEFGQSAKQTEANVVAFMRRWDEVHTQEDA